MQLLEVAQGNGPPDRTRVNHHRPVELLADEHKVCDGQTAAPSIHDYCDSHVTTRAVTADIE